ncbi:MAG: tyrosine-type recombinase/integrase [Solirubrobacteraceae bacterium]
MSVSTAALPIASVSGHAKLRSGKRRTTWYAKWRDARGEQFERKLGPAWTQKGPPPPGFLREKEANAALEAILTDARRGATEQARTGLTTSMLAEDWIAYGIHERDWKPSTLSDNRSVVNAHIDPTLGPRRPEKLTAAQIEDWRDELVEERGVSRRTANKALIVLGAILERGRKHGLVTNTAREVPKLRDRYDPNDYDFFSPEEIEQLVASAASDQDAAIYLLAAFTGLRMGELIALRWRDVDFDGESLHVYGSYSLGTLTAPKSGLARTVPMAKQVLATLKAHKRRLGDAGRETLLFPGERGPYLDGSALRRRYKTALVKAKLRPLRFHDLRHTFGSIAINEATIIQVQAWMGHADVQTTMKYMHHRSRAGDAKLLSAAFRPKKKRKPAAKKRSPGERERATA